MGERIISAEQTEQKNILFVDPEDLVKGNPAVLIVNRITYSAMESHFSPTQLDCPQVAWVMVHGDLGLERKLLIVDGFTRTKYCADHREEILLEYPNFRFAANEITSSLLKNPLICPEKNAEKQDALSVTQYLRAVVPYTIVHGEIAKERIAAHLINSWRNMVGIKIASEFSATAALAFLWQTSYVWQPSGSNEIEFQKILKRQKQFFINETGEEHQVLIKGFSEIFGIIKESKLDSKVVALAAFRLVGRESTVIGGGGEARKQIHGLLHSAQLREKLTGDEDSLAERENLRVQIIEAVLKGYRRFSRKDDKEQIEAINEALLDSTLTIRKTLDVISSPDPRISYLKARVNSNVNKLGACYLRLVNKERMSELDDLERRLVVNLGGKVMLNERDIPGAAKGISEIHNLIKAQVIPFRERLEENWDELIKKGVNLTTLVEVHKAMIDASESIFSVSSTIWLSRRSREIREIIKDGQEKINFQINKTRISQMADKILSKSLPARLKNQVILYIFQEEGYDLTEQQIEEKLNLLKSLDTGLLNSVIGGEITLFQALRNKNRDITVEKRILEANPGKQLKATTRAPREGLRQPLKLGKHTEKLEKERNNRSLEAALDYIFRVLIFLDPKKDNLSQENRERALVLINLLGQTFLDEGDLVDFYKKNKKE